jgi:hypothetical protein
MEVLRDGTFVFNIGSDELSVGLRSTKRNPRNKKFLVECVGAVGYDKVLQVIDDLQRIDDSGEEVNKEWPFPQIFVFTNIIIVCYAREIYEYYQGALVHKLTTWPTGSLWSAVDFYNFIYMSNSVDVVLRDPNSGEYSVTTNQPLANAICNFNGQVIISQSCQPPERNEG